MLVLLERLSSLEQKLDELSRRDDMHTASTDTADPLYNIAKALVVETRKASTSYLQRILQVGYSRAAALMDQLEVAGAIGPASGSRPRQILMTSKDLNSDPFLDWADTLSNEDDELYEDAKRVAQEAGKCSTSFLQRKLRIGYTRAARLVNTLEARGIIGPADGSRPRETVVTEARVELQIDDNELGKHAGTDIDEALDNYEESTKDDK